MRRFAFYTVSAQWFLGNAFPMAYTHWHKMALWCLLLCFLVLMVLTGHIMSITWIRINA